MVFNNHASNQASNRNDNSSNHQNNKAHKEAMSLRWTFQTIFRSDDETNPAKAGFILPANIYIECWRCCCCPSNRYFSI